jgi:putative ATPase
MDLFEQKKAADTALRPLAARMRPATLDEIVGQERIIGQGKLLRRAIEADRLNSLILYGPPGCGKTSLAEVIAQTTRRRFERTSGVLSNVAELRQLIAKADSVRRHEGRESILFVDEIHRFNKSQQDVLLPYVENGDITLIGATTHNPLFFINTPLTSRSLIFELNALSERAIETLLRNALERDAELARMDVEISGEALTHLARLAEGDGRRALNALEIALRSTPPDMKGVCVLSREVVEDSIQKKVVVYDHDEDGHYDTISAFIKSVRGSDAHAAVYWLAKMLYAGEDPRFVARRLIILASEDIGNADPRGLTVATAAMEAVNFVGMPEARIILSQATIYLATAPKSNASYVAIEKATQDVKEGRALPVPEHLKNVHLQTVSEGTDRGQKSYVYPHDATGHHVAQEYCPTTSRYYQPDGQGYEETIAKRMQGWETAWTEALQARPDEQHVGRGEDDE